LGKIVAYLRASTDKQGLSPQKLEIYEFARKQNLHIETFLEITISSRKTAQQRRVEEMLTVLEADDTLIVTELTR
jgi:DNA invertase Pin-like site-specific DNA recombinase